jgi:hypothetical protein
MSALPSTAAPKRTSSKVRIGPEASFDHLVGAGVYTGSFGQPRFPQTFDHQLRV